MENQPYAVNDIVMTSSTTDVTGLLPSTKYKIKSISQASSGNNNDVSSSFDLTLVPEETMESNIATTTEVDLQYVPAFGSLGKNREIHVSFLLCCWLLLFSYFFFLFFFSFFFLFLFSLSFFLSINFFFFFYLNNILEFIHKIIRSWCKEIGSCAACGVENPLMLCFDHKDRSKKIKSISNMCRDVEPFISISEEAQKTGILCQNCHTIKGLIYGENL